eukprot:scaffold119848_cov30-Tisochrysis_lutea.AAC.1
MSAHQLLPRGVLQSAHCLLDALELGELRTPRPRGLRLRGVHRAAPSQSRPEATSLAGHLPSRDSPCPPLSLPLASLFHSPLPWGRAARSRR